MTKYLLILALLLPAKVLAEGCSTQYGCTTKTIATTVGTSAVQIDSQPRGRDTICIWNNGSVTLYWGFSTALTAANGIPLPPGAGPICMGYGSNTAVFAIVASGTTDVRVLEQGGLGKPTGSVPGSVQ